MPEISRLDSFLHRPQFGDSDVNGPRLYLLHYRSSSQILEFERYHRELALDSRHIRKEHSSINRIPRSDLGHRFIPFRVSNQLAD